MGTGFDRPTLELLYRRLAPLRRRTPPFAPGALPHGLVTWVTPRLLAEIGFSEWTSAGLLRHPRFLGLREDKEAAEVRRDGVAKKAARANPRRAPHQPWPPSQGWPYFESHRASAAYTPTRGTMLAPHWAQLLVLRPNALHSEFADRLWK